MATCTDAQRLIAMSLGKIAVSRTQRGGANLHRSLLVSHVLHKARTAFMMENFQAMLQARQAQQHQQCGQAEEDQVVPEVVEQQPTAPATPLPQSQPQPGFPNPALREPQNQQSFPNPAMRENQPQPGDTRPVTVREEEDKENSPPSPAQRLEDSSYNKDSKKEEKEKDVSCAKCTVKRRLASSPCPQDVAPTSEKDPDPPSCKRVKTDYVQQSTPKSVSEKSSEEPMQTEAVQITNLVHRFNSGLSGLLSCSNSQNCQTENASCATQIVDSVPRFQDSLSRPVIALTV